MDIPHLLSELASVVGGVNVLAQAVPPELRLPSGWKNSLLATVVPGNSDEVAQIVTACEASGVAIVVVGGGTQLQTGYPPREETPYLLLSTARLNRVLDHQPDDMTITCEPGITIAAVQEHLRTHRQILPLDVPHEDKATVGGIVSTNQSGFWRNAFGAPRDLVIGLHAVMNGGARVKGGGKVVKNVAGYDVCKLFTGGWGTAGVITEVTFRVRPMPPSERVIRLDAPDLATAARAGLTLHHAQLAPISLITTNEVDGKPCLLSLLQGVEARMDWQTNEMARIGAPEGLQAPQVIPTSTFRDLGDKQGRLDAATPLAGRIACLLTDLEPILRKLQALLNLHLTADLAIGIIHFAANEPGPDFVQTLVNAVPDTANLRWTRINADTAERLGANHLNLWGETRETTLLQAALKQAIDPVGTFSPGRFVGRI